MTLLLRVREWKYSSSHCLNSALDWVGGQRFSLAALLTENIAGNLIIKIYGFNTFIQDIYNYITKTNHISTLSYSTAAVLYLQFFIHVIRHVTCVLLN
jgi:hypothetical protein